MKVCPECGKGMIAVVSSSDLLGPPIDYVRYNPDCIVNDLEREAHA